MNQETLRGFSDDVRSRDACELSLGDVLDVKVSILLVAITFLAGLSGGILISVKLPLVLKVGQIISLAALSVAGTLALFELRPRNYDFPDLPKFWDAWIKSLEKHYAGKEGKADLIYRTYVGGFIKRAEERIEKNHAINLTKSRLMTYCFWATGLSLAINLLTLWWLVSWFENTIFYR
jgi:hypothetical protein